MKLKHDIKVGDVYKTNTSGLLTVIEAKQCSIFTVKFIDSGYERDATRSAIVKGEVKDHSLIRTRRKCMKKFIITMNSGHVFEVEKLTEALVVVGETNINKLYEIARGRVIKDHPVLSIERAPNV